MLNFSGPEYIAAWPGDLLIDELTYTWMRNKSSDMTRRLLVEAFVGTGVCDAWDLAEHGSGFDDPPAWSRDDVVAEIVAAAKVGRLQHKRARAPFFRERQAQAAGKTDVTMSLLRKRFIQAVAELDNLGYFDMDGANQCIDDHGEPGPTMPDLVRDELGFWVSFDFCPRRHEPPLSLQPDEDGPSSIHDIGDDEFFDIVECLHDLAARPRTSSWHGYGDCGDHFDRFAVSPGQRLYRWRVNQLFDESATGLRLAEDGDLAGRLVEVADKARTELIERALSQADPEAGDQIAHAIDLFRKRGASVEDKRSAVIALARSLEEQRNLLKAELFKKDEGALFQIANEFDVRHQKSSQRSDYDPVFLDWIFWWYLATIELAQRLLDRQHSSSQSEAEARNQ